MTFQLKHFKWWLSTCTTNVFPQIFVSVISKEVQFVFFHKHIFFLTLSFFFWHAHFFLPLKIFLHAVFFTRAFFLTRRSFFSDSPRPFVSVKKTKNKYPKRTRKFTNWTSLDITLTKFQVKRTSSELVMN